MQGRTSRIGQKADVWIAGGKLSLKIPHAPTPDEHVIVSTDSDILIGVMHWSDDLRGTSTIVLDTRTGILHLSRLAMGTRDRKMVGMLSIWVCR